MGNYMYTSWKFIMKMILIHEDLYECIESKDGKPVCEDTKEQQKALARLCLSIKSVVSRACKPRLPQNTKRQNGGECKQFEALLKRHGIVHQSIVPHCLQQNSVAVRADRTIIEAARL